MLIALERGGKATSTRFTSDPADDITKWDLRHGLTPMPKIPFLASSVGRK